MGTDEFISLDYQCLQQHNNPLLKDMAHQDPSYKH
jgi:hypothetical protein